MANGQYNPSTGLTGACSFHANQLINQQHCNADHRLRLLQHRRHHHERADLQLQLQRPANAVDAQRRPPYQFGLIYTWSHAFDYEDNGAGSGSSGPAYSYPAYFKLNRAQPASTAPTTYSSGASTICPSAAARHCLTTASPAPSLAASRSTDSSATSAARPSTVSPSLRPSTPTGNDRVCATRRSLPSTRRPQPHAWQQPRSPAACHGSIQPPSRTLSSRSTQTRRAGYVDCSVPSCMSPRSSAIPAAIEFRGPGVTNVNASVSRSFKIYRESEFQVRVEAFNVAQPRGTRQQPQRNRRWRNIRIHHQLCPGQQRRCLTYAPVQRPHQLLTSQRTTSSGRLRKGPSFFLSSPHPVQNSQTLHEQRQK